MKRLLFGIFAHPDDEAFGPSAFLYRKATKGTDVHLVVVTDGDAGHNEGYDDLAKQRHSEWIESGKRIGAKSNKALHYPDGGLSNNLYRKICDEILKHIHEIIASYDGPLTLDFITFEERGITGHLDHIAVSFMTTYIYESLLRKPPENSQVGLLRYYCLSNKHITECNCDWLYMPAGRDESEIDEHIPYQDIADKKLAIMQAHESQKKDMEAIMLSHQNVPPEHAAVCTTDHFMHYHPNKTEQHHCFCKKKG